MRWLLCCLIPVAASAATPAGLKELHALAEKRSETIAITESRTIQAEERKTQAVGSLRPNVTARYSYQEVDPLPGPASPFRRINQYSALINLAQPIYRGGTWAAFSFAKIDIDVQKRLREQEGLGLWVQTGDAYYNLWMAQNDLVNVRQLRDFSDERVKEIRERVKVGRSRKGELLQAEAQLASVDADVARAESALAAAQEQVDFLAGTPQKMSFGALPSGEGQVATLNDYIIKIQDRPDVKARAEEVLLNEKLTSIAKAGHHPTVDFSANYYFERTGILAESEWDIGVVATLPLYQGGTVAANTREATERKREAVLTLERTKRESERDIRVLWQNSKALEAVVKDLKNAFGKSKATYEENKKDYRYGLVTNLDVLQSLNQYIDTKRGYERALLEKEMLALQLNLATGVTP
jgi:outer membrane protein